MSLFSIVQNRQPPPMPQPEMMAQPPMAAPSSAMPEAIPGQSLPPQPMLDGGVLPIPGFDNGGSWGMGWVNRRRGNTPQAQNALPSGELGQIIARMYNSDATSGATSLSFADYAALPSIRLEAEGALRTEGTGSGGADHFYEELAFKAQQAAQERRDAQQMANVEQQGNQQMAMMQYRKDLMSADAERKQVANSAIGQAQDTYAKLLSQADPNQGAIWRRPSEGYETVMRTQGPTYEAPNIPGTVFPSNWG